MYVELNIYRRGEMPTSYRFPIDIDPVSIGKASSCDIIVSGDDVEGEHCRLSVVGDRIIVELLGDGQLRASCCSTTISRGGKVELGVRDITEWAFADYFMRLKVFSKGGSKWEEFREARVLGAESKPELSPHSVAFAAFGARKLIANDQAIVDVWAYRDEHYTWVLEQATELQRERLLEKKAGARLTPGTAVEIALEVEDCKVPYPRETLVWNGEATNVSIVISLPDKPIHCLFFGRAILSVDGISIGSIQFSLRLNERGNTSVQDLPNHQWRPMRSAFASYSSKDRAEVLTRLHGIKAVAPEMDVFMDAFSLRAGEDWKRALAQAIQERDALLLFWPQAAAASKHVRQECRVALFTKGLEHIRPVPVEDPRDVPPPEELSALHFSDAYLAHIEFERRRKSLELGGG